MDLGGESTQIAYQFIPHSAGKDIDFVNEIFSKSFLSFGAKETQFRYENYLMMHRKDVLNNRGNSQMIPNPCNPVGLVEKTSVYSGKKHIGTGDVEIEITFYEGEPVGIVLPVNVTRTITYCEPGVKGDTSGKSLKPATLDTGIEVRVPLFINSEERIVIDTRDGSFVERAKN